MHAQSPTHAPAKMKASFVAAKVAELLGAKDSAITFSSSTASGTQPRPTRSPTTSCGVILSSFEPASDFSFGAAAALAVASEAIALQFARQAKFDEVQRSAVGPWERL